MKKDKVLRIATVFSGIGAIEQAIKKMNIPYEIVFACDNGERELKESIDSIKQYCDENEFDNLQINSYVKQKYDETKKPNYMKESYFANYKIEEDRWFEDIRFIDGKDFVNQVDLFVGGSPCQSFSMIGKRAGLEDARGTLFYDYARLVSEIKPKVFIYENVPGMLNHDNGNTWKVIQEIFNSLGYDIHTQILNASDYGIPQNRRRVYVVGFKKQRDNFKFPIKMKLNTSLFDYLEENIPIKYYLSYKGFNFVSNPKNSNRAAINRKIIKTQKANQQFNWNGDFIFESIDTLKNKDEVLKLAHVGNWNGQIGVIRKLTNRECLRLMGFADDFKIVVPDAHAYRQSGNSIVVNVLQNIMEEILKVEDFEDSIRVATVFSGIGGIEFALRRLNINHEIVFACDNGEREIDFNIEEEKNNVFNLKSIEEKHKYVEELYKSKTNKKNFVKDSYLANYNINPTRFFQDIILLDGRDFKGQVDLFVGGSPCQSFSSVGYQGGLEDARGTLFYEYARLVSEIQPNVFIFENVRNLLNHDNGKTWQVIKGIFDSLGYYYEFSVLNAADYGIPQNRRRLFVVGFKKHVDFVMPPPIKELKYEMKDFLETSCRYGEFTYKKDGSLRIGNIGSSVDDKYTLTPLLYKYVMNGGTKTFYQKPEINRPIARTLLKTMGNRHRAGIDNYVSIGGSTKVGDVRMLTEREAHRLMGFTDDYKIVVSRGQAYKQAGNSIVVDVLMSLLKEIIKTNIF